MDKEKIKLIIENHQHYLKKDCENWENMQANLCGADLSGADLRRADLREANMSYANLFNVDLVGADLREAKLTGANLAWCNLTGANLCGADLNLANLYQANLYRVRNMPFIPYVCPESGAFIGYKKAGGLIVELQIPEDAKRLSGTTKECRCDKAKVLRILNEDGSESETRKVPSFYDENFVYAVGAMAKVEDFDEDRWWGECRNGIHFFINFQEAVNYQFIGKGN